VESLTRISVFVEMGAVEVAEREGVGREV